MVIYRLLLKVVVLEIIILGPYHNHIAEADDSMTKPGCRSFCGNLEIPYPFGSNDSDPKCRIYDDSFRVYCDNSFEPPIPHMNIESPRFHILHISLQDHELRINTSISKACYDSSGERQYLGFKPSLILQKFPLSSAKNKFTAVGCDTSARFRDRNGKFSFGCMSSCKNITDVSNGSCSGIGCCQTSIPKNTFDYQISIGSDYNHSDVLDFNPCSYAFVTVNDFYTFSVGDLKQPEFDQSPLVLDWAIGNQTCEEAQKNRTSYMCTENTNCTNAENGLGYKCNCLEGYRGNPYLQNGCNGM
ncbi:wall-associated receptor kinase 2-like [Eucalyptus grandis]|uniref:wall-associated receptor kinase 2-like n=1 Tax=Eucalyptus grandis TaxID=71139 RepID=UPI00192E9451|nr:wall-associated receptor kinase 2-like [Eucalyptus grandis]